MWRADIMLYKLNDVSYKGGQGATVHAIVGYTFPYWHMLTDLMRQPVDKEEAIDFVQIIANTVAGMHTYEYKTESNPASRVFRNNVQSGVESISVWFEKYMQRVCEIKLNNKKTSWSDLKPFILGCNFAFITQQEDNRWGSVTSMNNVFTEDKLPRHPEVPKVKHILASYIKVPTTLQDTLLLMQTEVNNEEALVFVNVLANTYHGMDLMVDDKGLIVRKGGGMQKLKMLKNYSFVFEDHVLHLKHNKDNSVCSISLDTAKWRDLKQFILSCNYAVMTNKTKKIDIDERANLAEKQLQTFSHWDLPRNLLGFSTGS